MPVAEITLERLAEIESMARNSLAAVERVHPIAREFAKVALGTILELCAAIRTLRRKNGSKREGGES